MTTPLHEHEVLVGEHLGQIAGRYGIRRTDLLRLNPQLADPNLIRPGQKIRVCPEIPPRARNHVKHEVVQGETLEGLAMRYGLTVREILSFQAGKISDPNRIKVGDIIDVWIDGEILPEFRPEFRPEAPPRSSASQRLTRSVQLPTSRHYHVKRPHLAYGTPDTIDLIQGAIGRYAKRHANGPRLVVGDISKRGGGPLPHHVSHRAGRDVDVGYLRKGDDADAPRFTRVDARTLDVPRTWALVKSFLDTNRVKYVFMDHGVQKLLYQYARSQGVADDLLDELFQYPRSRYRAHGIIRHWRNHRDHFHVRFR
jgi:LysM repeat protein